MEKYILFFKTIYADWLDTQEPEMEGSRLSS